MNAASVGLDDSLDQTEAEAGASGSGLAKALPPRKNGSKMRACSSLGTPGPRSATRISTTWPLRQAFLAADTPIQLPLAGAVLGGVADQVFERLLEGQRIA